MSFVACPVQKKKSNMHFQSNRYYVIIFHLFRSN